MFLDVLRRRNPEFLRAVVDLHQSGALPPNAYVLDLDAIGANTRLIAEEAARLGLQAYAMTKQLGRSPSAIETIRSNGIAAGVAVDMACARAFAKAGLKLGHVGHLVQVSRHDAAEAASMLPENWTVFSHDKAEEAARAAHQLGRRQSLLARVHDAADRFYPGHEGGFDSGDLLRVADALDTLPGGRFAGVTTFPALLFDFDAAEVRATPNLTTVARAAEKLHAAGRTDVVVNAPGTTSTRVLSLLADAGATQVEPGHALTGTTPWHALKDLPEKPAIVYLSEVSHQYADRSYCFGGGLYVDPVFPPYQVRALVGADAEEVLASSVDAFLPPADAIDYYGQLDVFARTGDTVLFGFRPQAFVTRAVIAAVGGVANGAPRLEGLATAEGRPLAGGV
jgi:predicted amino acid racemase